MTWLDEGEELLVVALPRKLYDRIKTYGRPRTIIVEALAQEPPKQKLRTVSIDGGPMG